MDRATIGCGIELDRDRAEFARLDPLFPVAGGSTATGRPHLAHLKGLRAGIGKDESVLNELAGLNSTKIERGLVENDARTGRILAGGSGNSGRFRGNDLQSRDESQKCDDIFIHKWEC